MGQVIKWMMPRIVKTPPRTKFTLQFVTSLKVTDRKAITNGINQLTNTSAIDNPGDNDISPDITFSSAPGSNKYIA